MAVKKKEIAVFGGGCFWCAEAVFQSLQGVTSVMPGYAGGTKENPTYEQVCSGATGHAEVVKIEFDPAQINYRDLLTVFFASHDPTTFNRQGNDSGSQYRSLIFSTSDNQQRQAEAFINELNQSHQLGKSIVTEVKSLEKFYPAEDYHRQYYRNHKEQPYCRLIISPKLDKVRKQFARLLKSHGRS